MRRASPHRLQIPAGSALRGQGLREGTFVPRRERSARRDPRRGVGASLLRRWGTSHPVSPTPRSCTHCLAVGSPARALLHEPEPRPALPARLGLPGKGVVGGGLGWSPGRDAEGAALTSLPPSGANTLFLKGGAVSILTEPVKVAGRNPGKAWILRIRGCRSARSQRPAPRYQLYMAMPSKAEGLLGSYNQGTLIQYALS